MDRPGGLSYFGIGGGQSGGQSVPVLYAGGVTAYAGLDQVNVSIPQSLAGAGGVRVYLVADGAVSNAVGLKVE
jgi:uncharacterized protein (TIGR03437 family)